jgi:preprotein translocase subunit SecF
VNWLRNLIACLRDKFKNKPPSEHDEFNEILLRYKELNSTLLDAVKKLGPTYPKYIAVSAISAIVGAFIVIIAILLCCAFRQCNPEEGFPATKPCLCGICYAK